MNPNLIGHDLFRQNAYLTECTATVTAGTVVTARIEWARRHRLMRFHTTTRRVALGFAA